MRFDLGDVVYLHIPTKNDSFVILRLACLFYASILFSFTEDNKQTLIDFGPTWDVTGDPDVIHIYFNSPIFSMPF